ncbi:MAG TPA: hypothetical protein VH186_10630 [Chloroflexia bacterium]|nr:hypothetical protein [Chloroflexia bacterium]
MESGRVSALSAGLQRAIRKEDFTALAPLLREAEELGLELKVRVARHTSAVVTTYILEDKAGSYTSVWKNSTRH